MSQCVGGWRDNRVRQDMEIMESSPVLGIKLYRFFLTVNMRVNINEFLNVLFNLVSAY